MCNTCGPKAFGKAPNCSVADLLEILYGTPHWLPSYCSCCGVTIVTSTESDKLIGDFRSERLHLVDMFVLFFLVAPIVDIYRRLFFTSEFIEKTELIEI